MKNLQTAIQTILARAVKDTEPGIVLGIRQGGHTLFTAARGLANLETGTAFTATSAFRICSITKQFVCALVWREVLAGRIDVAAHPGKYVGWMKCFDPALTILHLMQNKSGIRDQWVMAMMMGAKPEQRFTLEDGFAAMRRAPASMFAPGSQSLYCNGNFELLGQILRAVSGQDFQLALQTHVLAPLGMKNTFVGVDTAKALPGNTRGYRHIKGKWVEEQNGVHWSASAGIVSTMEDIFKWDACLRDPAASGLPWVDKIKTPQPFTNGASAAYASGINHWQAHGRAVLTHQGALRGWRSILLRFVAEDTAIAVFMNRTNSPSGYFPSRVAYAAAKALGIKPVWQTAATKKRAVARVASPGWYCSIEQGLLMQLRNPPSGAVANFQRDADKLFAGDQAHVVESDDQYLRIIQTKRTQLVTSFEEANMHALMQRCAPGQANTPDKPISASKKLTKPACFASGSYQCAPIDTTLVLAATAKGTTIQFSGPFGKGEVYPVEVINTTTAYFEISRGVDETPPGRMLIVFDAAAKSLEISGALARRVVFRRG